MKSILQREAVCFVTGRRDNLHCHHVFFGSGKRKLSEKYGLKVYLVGELHNLSKEGVHFVREFDTALKCFAQKKAMQYYGWSTEDFIKIFGENYI